MLQIFIKFSNLVARKIRFISVFQTCIQIINTAFIIRKCKITDKNRLNVTGKHTIIKKYLIIDICGQF